MPLKNDCFSRSPIRQSKVNAVASEHLAYKMVTSRTNLSMYTAIYWVQHIRHEVSSNVTRACWHGYLKSGRSWPVAVDTIYAFNNSIVFAYIHAKLSVIIPHPYPNFSDVWVKPPFNTLMPRQNGRHFPDDIFKCILLEWNCMNFDKKNSLKFVLKDPINNIPALVRIMAWYRPGDKPLSDPMMVRLPTYICGTGPQCVELEMGGWLNTTEQYGR